MNHEEKREEMLQATALKYDAGADAAPMIVGMGVGHVASNILTEAQAHGVAIVEDRETSHLLQKLNIGQEIPQELYQVVAEILLLIARMDADQGKRFGL